MGPQNSSLFARPSWRKQQAITLVEVLVAVAVVSLALGPLIGLLSQSNRQSSASIYEVMAVHFAAELLEQVQRLGPRLPAIIADARTKTSNATLTLKNLLTDTGFLTELRAASSAPRAVPLQSGGAKLDTSLILSPQTDQFQRWLEVDELSTTGNTVLRGARFWKVTAIIGWRMVPSEPINRYQAKFSIVVRE
jgi:type II secretory pathway pseudopilin PulG